MLIKKTHTHARAHTHTHTHTHKIYIPEQMYFLPAVHHPTPFFLAFPCLIYCQFFAICAWLWPCVFGTQFGRSCAHCITDSIVLASALQSALGYVKGSGSCKNYEFVLGMYGVFDLVFLECMGVLTLCSWNVWGFWPCILGMCGVFYLVFLEYVGFLTLCSWNLWGFWPCILGMSGVFDLVFLECVGFLTLCSWNMWGFWPCILGMYGVFDLVFLECVGFLTLCSWHVWGFWHHNG